MHCEQILKIFQIILNCQRLLVIKEGKKFPLIPTPDIYSYSTAVSYQPVSSVHLLSLVWLCDPMNHSTLGLPVHHQLPEIFQTHVHWVSDAIQPSILCCPLLLPLSVFPSIRAFSNESVLCIRWPKYWSFNFSVSPSNEYSGLISFRIDWLDLLAVQGTLKSLLQHHSSKASILRHLAFFKEIKIILYFSYYVYKRDPSHCI